MLAPKLKAMRLQYERRNAKGRKIRVLALRDQHGTLKRVARSKSEQDELEEWWQDYNRKLKFEELPVSKKLRTELALVRENLRKQGFIYSHLWYGTTKRKGTRKSQYKYLIIFKATRWTAIEAARVTAFFRRHIPKTDLGIFVYHNKKLHMWKS